MPTTFEVLSGTLGIDAGAWQQGLDRAKTALDQFTSNAKSAFSRIADAGRELSQSVSVITAVGTGVAAVMVRMAAKVEEVGDLMGDVFDQRAPIVAKSLESFAGKVGIGCSGLKEMAAQLAVMVEGFGVAPDKVALMSAALTKLTVDVASFTGKSKEEVNSAIVAGLAGRTMGLKRLGIVINETRIEQEAYRLGLAKTKDQITDAVKAETMYSLIMASTARMHGDAAKDSQMLGGQMERLNTAFKAAGTAMGEVLLPYATVSAQALNRMLEPVNGLAQRIKAFAASHKELAESQAKEFWESLWAWLQRLGAMFDRVGDSLKPLAARFTSLRDAVSDAAAPMRRLFDSLPQGTKDLALLGGVLGGVAYGFKGLLGWIEKVPVFGKFFVETLAQLVSAFNPLRGVLVILQPMFAAVVGALASISAPVLAAAAAIGGLVAMLVTAYQNSDRFRQAVDGIVASVAVAFEFARESVAGFVANGLNWLSEWWTDGKGAISGIDLQAAWVNFCVTLVEGLMNAGNAVVTWLQPRLEWLGEFVSETLWPTMKEWGSWLSDVLVAGFVAVKNAVVNLVSAGMNMLSDWWDVEGENVTRMSEKWLDLFIRGCQAVWQVITDKIVPALASMGEWLAENVLPILKTVAGYLSDVFVWTLGKVGDAISFIVRVCEAVADVLNGDFRRAFVLASKPIALLLDSVKALLNGVADVIDYLGGGYAVTMFRNAAQNVDNYAKSIRAATETTQESLTVEEKQIAVKRQLAKAEQERLAEITAAKKKAAEDDLATERAYLAAKKQADKDAQAQGSAVDRPSVQAGQAGQNAANGVLRGRQDLSGPDFAGASNPSKLFDQPADSGNSGGPAIDFNALQTATRAEIREVNKAITEEMKQNLAGLQEQDIASAVEMRQLAILRKQATDAINAINGTYGEARQDAVGSAVAAQEAFQNAFDAIVARGKQSAEQLKQIRRDQAADAKRQADEQAANEIEDIEKVEKKAQEAAGKVSGKGGATGGSAGAAQASEPTMWDMIGNVGSQLAGMFTAATAGIGDAMSQFNGYIKSITNPVEQIDAQIQMLTAKVSGMSINLGNFGGNGSDIATVQEQIKDLQRQRQLAVANQANEARASQLSYRAAYQRRQEQLANDKADAMREQGLDLASMVSVGAKQPIVMNINGINDVGQALDRLEKEMQRRGHNRGIKRSVEVRK